MDLASFAINILNKLEPITDSSQSLLRVSLSEEFKKQNEAMNTFKEVEQMNFQIDQEIEKLPLDLPAEQYEERKNALENRKRPFPKVNVLTKSVSFMSKPMAQLGLYILFIVVSAWLTKRSLTKSDEPDEDFEDNDEKRKPSKKERKILKKYGHEIS